MSTQFRCTACGELLVFDEATTSPIRCPHCQVLVIVREGVVDVYAPPASPPSRQGLAIVALVCGFVGLVGCFPVGLVGLVLGIVALVKALEQPQENQGKGMAIAGICMSAVGLLFPTSPIAFLSERPHKLSEKLVCAANLKGIGTSVRIYASEWKGQFPADLQVLFDTGEVSFRQLVCPSSGAKDDDRTSWYVYISGQTSEDDSRNVLAYEKAGNHKKEGANVLFLDGHVEFVTRYSHVEQMVAETKQRVAEARKKQTPEAP